MNTYEKNLEFFKQQLYPLYKTITEIESNYNTIIENIEENMNCIVQNESTKCFVHSIYDKDREIKEMFKNADSGTSRLIVFGMGFGYSMKYIQDNFKNLKELIIVEPDLNLFKRILKNLDFSDLRKYFMGKNVTFIINKTKEDTAEILADMFKNTTSLKISFVTNLAYKSLYDGYFESVEKSLIKIINQIKTNVVTNSSSKERWAFNIIKNVMQQPDARLESFIDKFHNKTAIIVSAGPSLNKNIHLLEKAKNKAVIFAPGSAIKILDSHGIVPDFRFAMDAWETENRIFQNINTEATALVYDNSIYEEIIPNYKGKKINMILNADFLSKYIFEKLGLDVIEIPSGYSIANVVLSTIIKMKFKKVIFMGQDLCYTDGKLHAIGSWSDAEANIKQMKKFKNIYNEDVYTTDPFLSMKYLFESTIRNSKGIDFINATEGGLELEGAENKKFEEVLKQLNENENINDIKELVFKQNRIENYEERIHNVLLEIQRQNEQILEINREGLKRIKKLKKYRERNMGLNKLGFELDSMIKYEEKLNEIDLYKRVINPVLRDDFYSDKINFEYSGEDKYKKVISKENILIASSTKVNNYVSLLYRLIEDSKNN